MVLIRRTGAVYHRRLFANQSFVMAVAIEKGKLKDENKYFEPK